MKHYYVGKFVFRRISDSNFPLSLKNMKQIQIRILIMYSKYTRSFETLKRKEIET